MPQLSAATQQLHAARPGEPCLPYDALRLPIGTAGRQDSYRIINAWQQQDYGGSRFLIKPSSQRADALRLADEARRTGTTGSSAALTASVWVVVMDVPNTSALRLRGRSFRVPGRAVWSMMAQVREPAKSPRHDGISGIREVTPVVLLEQQTADQREAAARAADIAEGLTLVCRYLGQRSRAHGANRAEADQRMAFRLECQIEALQRLAEDLAAIGTPAEPTPPGSIPVS